MVSSLTASVMVCLASSWTEATSQHLPLHYQGSQITQDILPKVMQYGGNKAAPGRSTQNGQVLQTPKQLCEPDSY